MPGRPIRLFSQDRSPRRQCRTPTTTAPWCLDAHPATPPASNRRRTHTAMGPTCSETLHNRTFAPFMFADNINEGPPDRRPIRSQIP
jgi:hypothetical protein